MESKNSKILLVEDDQALGFIVKDNLEQGGFQVDLAEDGELALELYQSGIFSLIILDVMLPKKDGFTVAKEIRKTDENIPILFLTARSMTEDRIKGLTLGGDDYITKPFSMEELLLKIKIFLKRSGVNTAAGESNGEVEIGRYTFKPDDLILAFDEQKKRLTMKEAELITLFSENRNKILSRSEILKKIWGSDDYFLGRSLDVFISRLRKYFNHDPDIKIVNIHGIGFRFNIKTKK